MAKAQRKPLSFSTTMRNPNRMAGFLMCLYEFKGQILTSQIIHAVIKNVLNNKIYTTLYQKSIPALKDKIEQATPYSDTEIADIIKNSPQNHKEAGFDKGWESRFDTWYKLAMEFGFVYYAKGEKIEFSTSGKALIDEYQQEFINEINVQNLFLNALAKYQINNPFRKNLNDNNPLVLLLKVLTLLKNDKQENGAGLYRKELPLLICWQNQDEKALYEYIKQLRKAFGFSYADELIYERCLALLDADDSQRNRFKMTQICAEAVDEYIRKMRSTGIISLRGNGRFIDLNSLEKQRIDYIINHYDKPVLFYDKKSYYQYMGQVDSHITTTTQKSPQDNQNIKQSALLKYAKEYSKDKVYEELKNLTHKKPSKDLLLKFISEPTRLEFLISIALVQQFDDIHVLPNYVVDDEGLPIFTAGGNGADIVCLAKDCHGLIEVTLMRGRQDQIAHEMIPIRRHLLDYQKQNPDVHTVFSLFVAPIIHEDTQEMSQWYKHKDDICIVTIDIMNFLAKIDTMAQLSELSK